MDAHRFQEKKNEFHDKLAKLILEYPELSNPPEEYREEYPEGFDNDAPKIIEGLVLIIAYQNIDGYGELVWTMPADQSYYTTVGLLTKAAGGIL